MYAKLVKTIDLACSLGESILWDARNSRLWLTDILGMEMLCHDTASGVTTRFVTPEALCAFGLTDDPDIFIAAFATGFAYYAPHKNSVAWINRPPELADGALRLNDGRVDPQGRFWCGSLVLDANAASKRTGTLYSLTGDGEVKVHDSGFGISNGLCWSPENNRQYFSDCATSEVFAYDYEPVSGSISNRKTIAITPAGASPDGAITDAEGFIWSAHWGASEVVRYAPDGRIDDALAVPTAQPTCVAFGGEGLSNLYVSSARIGLETTKGQEQAGHVFVYEVEVRGLPTPFF
ncbi:MAG: SMP-30/gluconolactonase/LRE family protein [Asticcacaulis sp.]